MQVGATAAVGLLEGGSGISWSVMNRTIVGWVMTLVVVGFLSALIMALGVFSPNLNAAKAMSNIKASVNEVGLGQADILAQECLGQPDGAENVEVRFSSQIRFTTAEACAISSLKHTIFEFWFLQKQLQSNSRFRVIGKMCAADVCT